MLKSLPATLLFMLVVFVVTAMTVALVLVYGWLFTLITPLDLWQTVILTTIALVALIMGVTNMALLPYGNLINYLLFGMPIATGIGILFGWLLTLIVSFDTWRAMLLGVILVGAVAYLLLRLSGDFLEAIEELEMEGEEENEDPSEGYRFVKKVDPSLFEDAILVDKEGRPVTRPRKRRKDKKS